MVFAESRLKDVYRKVIWGPWREGLTRLPAGWEPRVNRNLGRAAWLGSPAKRAHVRANLVRAFGERPDLDRVVRRTFENHFADQYSSWFYGRMAAGNESAYLDLHGVEHLDAALARGKGVVIMHPHLGIPQLPLCALGARGYRMNQIGGGGVEGVSSAEGQRVTALRAELEKGIPARIWNGAGFLRPVLRALAEGEVVMSAIDGTGGGREIGRRLPRRILGQTMKVPVGAVFLAWKAKAPLLTVHCFREGGRYKALIGPERPFSRTAPMDEVLEEGADIIAAWLEELLRLHPGDWHFWDEFEPGRFLE